MPQHPQLPVRIGLKVFFDGEPSVTAAQWVELFNRWIQNETVGELLIDVHDYSHVGDGPSVILVAHEAHYRVDRRDGQWGLLYSRKRQLEGSLEQRLTAVFRGALSAAVALAADDEIGDRIRFDTGRLALRVDDRLALPIGARIDGPAILEQPDTTIFVEPGLSAEVDQFGNLVVKPDA